MRTTARILAACTLGLPLLAQAYPYDGYPYTGIRRLDWVHLVKEGQTRGRILESGQYLTMEQVVPLWRGSGALPPQDSTMSGRLAALLDPATRGDFAVAVIDLTDPRRAVFGAHNPDYLANVGSVAKILIALAVFQKLADLYPNDIPARERVLREATVIADAFSQWDTHKVPIWHPSQKLRESRQLEVGDRGSLWEYLDWAISASSNAAGSMVMKELIALAHFGKRYPVPEAEKEAFFKSTSRERLGRIYLDAMVGPLSRNGLDPQRMRQGSFFTRGGNARVANTTSYATVTELVKFMLRLEAGTLVDAWSSREIKRLLYLTQRRIRYASHPVLNDSAVSYKSGSFFQCHGGRGCAKYKGDKTNRLASVAIIESPAGEAKLHYIVVVMSNVLRVNSAVAHQTLALRIHRLIESLHPDVAPPPIPDSAFPAVPVDDTEPGP